MPDYTEEDVERVARALEPEVFSDDPIIAHRSASPLTVAVVREKALTFARATLDIAYPLAYTAGALAMKEAAALRAEMSAEAEECRWIKHDSAPARARSQALLQIATAIRALPVPPRGSKL